MKKLISLGVASLLAVVGLVGGPVEDASAAPSCKAGYVCMWTKTNGGGTKNMYSRQANHSHAVASVNYNYNKLAIKFTTSSGGEGAEITRYNLNQRGFRNWDKGNWNRCRSHWDLKPW